jgi:hypothetical protein
MSTTDGWDELVERAKGSAQGGGTPAEWGTKIDLEVGETFRGRHRGHEEGGKSGAYLAWDTEQQERFIWACAALDREYDRERPGLGDDVAIAREGNYRTRFDDPGDEPTGLSYGVATRTNSEPLPELATDASEPAGPDDIPF